MRHFVYLTIAAAAATMAACSNNELLTETLSQENNAPSMIGFTSYSEKETKGNTSVDTNLEYYHSSFAVYGTKQSVYNSTDVQYVFGGKAEKKDTVDGETCKYLASTMEPLLGDWRYEDPRYWDKKANYAFIAYAPASDKNPLRYVYTAAKALVGDPENKFVTRETFVLEGTNLQATPSGAPKVKGFTVEAGHDLDLMTAGAVTQSGSSHSEYVTFVFRHILSKLNVSFDKTEALQNSTVTIREVTITGLKDAGDYDEGQYNNTLSTSGWTASYSDDAEDHAPSYTGTKTLNNGTYSSTNNAFTKGDRIFFIESLIMPQKITAENQVKLTAKYTIKSGNHTEDYTSVLDLYEVEQFHQFFDGYNYTLRLTIGPDMIKFDSSVGTWADQTAVDWRLED